MKESHLLTLTFPHLDVPICSLSVRPETAKHNDSVNDVDLDRTARNFAFCMSLNLMESNHQISQDRNATRLHWRFYHDVLPLPPYLPITMSRRCLRDYRSFSCFASRVHMTARNRQLALEFYTVNFSFYPEMRDRVDPVLWIRQDRWRTVLPILSIYICGCAKRQDSSVQDFIDNAKRTAYISFGRYQGRSQDIQPIIRKGDHTKGI
jgi:hypothetical protein